LTFGMISSATPVHVCADERRVRQVLLNLVTNAIRYNRADGTVFVGWTVDDGQVRITVRDTGPGIAAEHLDRLFTPFDRLGRDSEEGVGLGLPLARGLTETMGGTLDVQSEIDEGTTVTVVLPLSHSRRR
jgi:signal transduction histidine kinase